MHPLEASFLHSIDSRHLIARGQKVLVAASGGADSTALAHLLAAWSPRLGIEVALAHFNHGLRGAESDGDAVFTAELAAGLGLRFVGGSGDARALARVGRLSLEEAARELRHAFLLRVAADLGAERVALGHHADDNAETLLLNLIRGAGARGLSGMPVCRPPFVRPLLGARRAEIIDYLATRGLPFRTDSSNRSNEHLRNRIRLELLPQLERLNPGIAEVLARLGAIAGEEDRFLDELAAARLVELRRGEARSEIGLDRQLFLALPTALRRRVFRLAYEALAGNRRRLAAPHAAAFIGLAEANRPSGRIRLPAGYQAVREYDRLLLRRVERQSDTGAPETMRLPIPGAEDWRGWRISARLLPRAPEAFPARDAAEAFFDPRALAGPLVLWRAAAGERMAPFGARPRKISDLLGEARIPRAARDNWPVIRDGNGTIVWLPGIARSDLAPVVDRRAPCLCLSCRSAGECVASTLRNGE